MVTIPEFQGTFPKLTRLGFDSNVHHDLWEITMTMVFGGWKAEKSCLLFAMASFDGAVHLYRSNLNDPSEMANNLFETPPGVFLLSGRLHIYIYICIYIYKYIYISIYIYSTYIHFIYHRDANLMVSYLNWIFPTFRLGSPTSPAAMTEDLFQEAWQLRCSHNFWAFRYCWWFRNPARKPVEAGSLSHDLQGFINPSGWEWDLEPSSVSRAESRHRTPA